MEITDLRSLASEKEVDKVVSRKGRPYKLQTMGKMQKERRVPGCSGRTGARTHWDMLGLVLKVDEAEVRTYGLEKI